jgi:hypothetical protein
LRKPNARPALPVRKYAAARKARPVCSRPRVCRTRSRRDAVFFIQPALEVAGSMPRNPSEIGRSVLPRPSTRRASLSELSVAQADGLKGGRKNVSPVSGSSAHERSCKRLPQAVLPARHYGFGSFPTS